MRGERQRALRPGERPDVDVDRARGADAVAETAFHFVSEPREEKRGRHERRQRQQRPRDAQAGDGPAVEGDAVDQAEVRHARGVTHGDALRDASAESMTDDARALDAQFVEQGDDAIGVRARVDGARQRTVAAPVAEEVEHDETMSRRHERNDFAPEMAGGRESVDEHDRIARAARAGGVVVETRARQIDELTAHASARLAWGGEDASGRFENASNRSAERKKNAGRRWTARAFSISDDATTSEAPVHRRDVPAGTRP